MAMAVLCAKRGTCARRQVGCVLIDEHDHVLSTGYNGRIAGAPHCIDVKCAGVNQKSGEGLDLCEAVHAEENALLQCRDVYAIKTCFCTTLPCPRCLRQLMNTSCIALYYLYDYGDAKMTIAKWQASRILRMAYKLPMIRLITQRFVEDEDCEWENI